MCPLCCHPCRHGEVSRAMRNRGIEVFILPEEQSQCRHPPEAKLHDYKSIASLHGLPPNVTALMADTHRDVGTVASSSHRKAPSLRELHRWAELTAALCSRGWAYREAIRIGFQQIYLSPEYSAFPHVLENLGALFEELWREHCTNNNGQAFFSPCMWPVAQTVTALAEDSMAFAVARDGAVTLLHVSRLSAAELGELVPGNIAAEATLVTKHAWAAAVLLPGKQLQQLLSGSDVHPNNSSGINAYLEALCALAAAGVSVQRENKDALQREGWMAAATQQLRTLLLELQVPPSSRCWQALQLARNLHTALLSGSGWLAVQQGKQLQQPGEPAWFPLIHQSMEASVLLEQASTEAPNDQPQSLLQLSYWRFKHAKVGQLETTCIAVMISRC
jgi:hypothetical protein